MTIQFQCHGCGNPFAVPEQMAGSMASCNRCGTVVTVPRAAAPAPQPSYGAPATPWPAQQGPASGQPGMYPIQPGLGMPLQGQPQYPGMQTGYGQPLPGQSPYGMGQPMPGQAPFGMGLPPVKPAAGMPLPLLIGGGGGAVVVVLGAILFFTMGGSSQPQPDLANNANPLVAPTPFTPPPNPAPPPYGTPNPSPSSPNTTPTNTSSSSPSTSSATSNNPATTPATSPSPLPPAVAPTAPSVGSDGRPNIPLRVRLDGGSGNRPSKRLESEADEESWEKPFSTFGKKEDEEKLIPWTAKADPTPAPLDFKKGKIAVPFPKDNRYELELPEGPSNFVFAHANSRGQHAFQPFDVRSGKSIGKAIVSDLHTWRPKFSPDGRYIAFQPTGVRSGIKVGSFVTGEQVQEIVVGEDDRIRKFMFAGPHKMLTVVSSRSKNLLHLWDLKSGELTLEVQLPDNWDNRLVEDSVTVSPGGKYVICILGTKLSVVDLETGQAAGQASVGEKMLWCSGSGFSSEGDRFVIFGYLWGLGDRMIVLDMNQGVVQTNVRTNTHFGFGNDGPMVQFTPDDEMVLYKSEVLIDVKTGRAVWKFQNTWHENVKMLRLSDVLVAVKDGKQPGLQTISVPGANIAKALEHVRKGGTGADLNLPPLTEANLAVGTKRELPEQPVKWAYQPIAGDSGYAGNDKDVKVAAAGESIRAARFAGPGLSQVVLYRESRSTAEGRPESKFQIERLDLETGSKTSGLFLPESYALTDVSPSGDLAVVSFTENERKVTRMDVVALSPKKHILGLRPYTEDATKADTRSRSGADNVGESRTTVLVNDERLLTLNPRGKLVVWDVANGNAVYYYEKFGRLLAFSPTRKTFVAVHKGNFRMFDSATGDVVGSLETPFNGTFCRAAAFRPDGLELAAVLDAGHDKIVVRWNLATGMVDQEFPVNGDVFRGANAEQASEKNLVYRGKDHVLIAGEYLLNLPQRAVVWRYSNANEGVVPGNSDTKAWYCLQKGGDDESPVYLTARDMPSELVASSASHVRLEEQLLLFPGAAVKLDIDLSSVGLQAHNATVQKAVDESLAQRGIVVRPTGLSMTVRAGEQATGAQIGVSRSTNPFGGMPRTNATPDQIISQKMLVCNFAINDPAGRTVWSQALSVPMRSWGQVNTGDAENQLRKEMYDQFSSMLSAKRVSLGIPTFIFKPLTQAVAGESEFYAGGERDPRGRTKQPAGQQPAGQPNQPFSSNPFGGAAAP